MLKFDITQLYYAEDELNFVRTNIVGTNSDCDRDPIYCQFLDKTAC